MIDFGKLYSQKNINLAVIIFMIFVSVVMLAYHLWFSPDQFFVFVGIIMLFLGRIKGYLRDWTIPIFLLLLFDFLRGALPHLTILPHVNPMIKFGMLKDYTTSIVLQNSLASDNLVHWYDFLAVFIYMSHFIIPMLIALIFWLNNRREDFKEYMATLVVLSYLALITFIIFPTMPPWMASENGYIPYLKKIYDFVVRL